MSVEDDDAAYLIFQHAVEEVLPLYTLYRAKDGVEALQFVRKVLPFPNVPTPNLVFLDLNLPKLNGKEVLEEMHNDSELHRIPVVVFSGSEVPDDRSQCLALGARHYIPKMSNYVDLLQTVLVASEFATS